VKVKTTYLQMVARPERVVPPPRVRLAVVHGTKPPVASRCRRNSCNTTGLSSDSALLRDQPLMSPRPLSWTKM
jgi:hypothetical protein